HVVVDLAAQHRVLPFGGIAEGHGVEMRIEEQRLLAVLAADEAADVADATLEGLDLRYRQALLPHVIGVEVRDRLLVARRVGTWNPYHLREQIDRLAAKLVDLRQHDSLGLGKRHPAPRFTHDVVLLKYIYHCRRVRAPCARRRGASCRPASRPA